MSEANKAVIRSFVGAVNAQDWDNLRVLLVPHSSDAVTLVAPPRFVQLRN